MAYGQNAPSCDPLIHLFVSAADKARIRPKKKLLYWRNPTNPKIRPDPTFFFKKTKKKTKKKRPTDPKKSKTCDVFFLNILFWL